MTVLAAHLPRRKVATLEEAARLCGGLCTTVREAETIRRPPHVGRPARLSPLTPATDDEALRTAVAELPQGRVIGQRRTVITPSRHVVDDVRAAVAGQPPYRRPYPATPMHVSGRVAVLGCATDATYDGFLLDAMTRLGVLEAAGLLGTVDHFYVPTSAPFQRELLDLLRVPADRCIDANSHPHIRADCLLVCSVPSRPRVDPPWLIDFLRRRLARPRPRRPKGRLYVAAGISTNRRDDRNHEELVHFLLRRGFEVVDPATLPVRRQIGLFADASLIVAHHGPSLANLVVVPEGAGVVELFPPGRVAPTYWRLASAVPEVRYRYLSSWPRRAASNRLRGAGDIDVTIEDLAALLDEVS